MSPQRRARFALGVASLGLASACLHGEGPACQATAAPAALEPEQGSLLQSRSSRRQSKLAPAAPQNATAAGTVETMYWCQGLIENVVVRDVLVVSDCQLHGVTVQGTVTVHGFHTLTVTDNSRIGAIEVSGGSDVVIKSSSVSGTLSMVHSGNLQAVLSWLSNVIVLSSGVASITKGSLRNLVVSGSAGASLVEAQVTGSLTAIDVSGNVQLEGRSSVRGNFSSMLVAGETIIDGHSFVRDRVHVKAGSGAIRMQNLERATMGLHVEHFPGPVVLSGLTVREVKMEHLSGPVDLTRLRTSHTSSFLDLRSDLVAFECGFAGGMVVADGQMTVTKFLASEGRVFFRDNSISQAIVQDHNGTTTFVQNTIFLLISTDNVPPSTCVSNQIMRLEGTCQSFR